MGTQEATALQGIEARDVSGQKVVRVGRVPTDRTVGELVYSLLEKMELPVNRNGEQITYHARLDREGRALNNSEFCGDALQNKDKITIQPRITAG